eukprot:7420530-Pyramimonas_sp.AAC.1
MRRPSSRQKAPLGVHVRVVAAPRLRAGVLAEAEAAPLRLPCNTYVTLAEAAEAKAEALVAQNEALMLHLCYTCVTLMLHFCYTYGTACPQAEAAEAKAEALVAQNEAERAGEVAGMAR